MFKTKQNIMFTTIISLILLIVIGITVRTWISHLANPDVLLVIWDMLDTLGTVITILYGLSKISKENTKNQLYSSRRFLLDVQTMLSELLGELEEFYTYLSNNQHHYLHRIFKKKNNNEHNPDLQGLTIKKYKYNTIKNLVESVKSDIDFTDLINQHVLLKTIHAENISTLKEIKDLIKKIQTQFHIEI